VPTLINIPTKFPKGPELGWSIRQQFRILPSFYHEVETKFLPRLTDLHILKYLRYQDDIIVVSATLQALKDFMTVFKKCLSFFRFTMRCIGTSVSILDLDVTIYNGSRISVSPSLNKIPIPLCPSSCHAPHTHAAWPDAVRKRIISLSDVNSQDFTPAKCVEKLLDLYSRVPLDRLILDRLRGTRTHIHTPSSSQSVGVDRGGGLPQQIRIASIMRYHPCVHRAFRAALKLAPPPPSLNIKLTGAWQNAVKSTTSIINHSNRRHVRNQNQMHNGRAHHQQGKGIAFDSDLSMYTLNNLCLSERAFPPSLARELGTA